MNGNRFFFAKMAECEQLAKLAPDREHRDAYQDLARKWQDLAATSQQNADAMVDGYEA